MRFLEIYKRKNIVENKTPTTKMGVKIVRL